MNQASGPLRRALIYGLLSYGGLVVINNSGLILPNMWLAYLPMFLLVYGITQWADRAIASRSAAKKSPTDD